VASPTISPLAQAGTPSALLGALVSLTLLAAAAIPGAAAAASGCTIVGTPGADRLVGTQNADGICGRGGADTIIGRGGGDWLSGGPGADTLSGGNGRDLLEGGPGNDELGGGRGNDELRGGPGFNRCRDATVITTQGCSAPRLPMPVALFPPPAPPMPPPPPPGDEPDTIAPFLQSLEFSTENVEIATGDWWVELSLSAQDENEIESVTVTIEGPGGIWREVSLGPAPADPGKLNTKVDVPASTPVGEYRVTAVTLVDEVGNSISHDLPWLAEYGMDDRFEVYDGPDREAPNLVGISFGEGEVVDTSKGPVTVQVPIEVTDPGSGVETVYMRVSHPTTKPGNERFYSATATLDSGTAREGTWLATFELPSGSTAGFYPVKELALKDAEGQWRTHNSATLEDRGFPGGFTQVGAADTTRPKITSFSIEPQVLHTAAGERKLEVKIGVADDWSGVNGGIDPVSDVGFWLTPPDWPSSWGMGGNTELISGTYLEGTWQLNRWLEEDAAFGTWTVRWITVTDRAGNTTRLEDGPLEDFEAEGWDLSFENLP
jgi:RTX calcium-binding nonapeptide repeat (4 copies)